IYRDQGYAEVQVATKTFSAAPHQIDIQFHIQEGPLYHVGTVSVVGNQHLSQDLIKRDFGVSPGELFSQTKLYEGSKQLFLSGYMETVDVQVSSGTDHLMDLTLHVKERPTQFIKGGLGYGTETKERVSLGYEDRNFFGQERRWDISATHSG